MTPMLSACVPRIRLRTVPGRLRHHPIEPHTPHFPTPSSRCHASLPYSPQSLPCLSPVEEK